MSARRASLGAIFLTVFLDLLGFGLVLPFLAEQARDTFGSSDFVGTLLSSVYSLAQFVFVPIWGNVSDRVGRRPVLLWSVLASAVGMGLLGFGLSLHWGLWALFAARIFSGIATANLGTASAYIADVTKPEDRAKGMGLIGMAFGLGFIIGPGVGGMLAHIKVMGHEGAVPCFVAAGLSVLNFGWVWFGLGESLPKEKRGKDLRPIRPLDLVGMRQTLAAPGLGTAVIVNFVLVLSFTNLDQTFRYFNKDLFGMTVRQTGFVLAFIGITAALVQGGLIRRIAHKVDEARLIQAGTFIQSGAFGMLAVSPLVGQWFLYPAGALLALGNGLTQPSISAFVSRRADATRQGTTLSANQSVAALARTVGPAFGGFLYGNLGRTAPYTVAAAGMGLALLLALRLPLRPKEPPVST